MKNFRVETPHGSVVFSADSPNPRVLAIHGFLRQADQLLPWRERIPGLGFVHLPGHSNAPDLSEVSVPAWAASLDAMMDVFEQPPLLIAESLGAVIAMHLRSRALIAVEPLLSTHSLWPLHRAIRRLRAQGVEVRADHEALFGRPFTDVLTRIRAPTLVLAGMEPLLPPRPVEGAPSLLSDEDFAAYAGHRLVEARRIPGGHALLDESPGQVIEAAAGFMARHGYLG